MNKHETFISNFKPDERDDVGGFERDLKAVIDQAVCDALDEILEEIKVLPLWKLERRYGCTEVISKHETECFINSIKSKHGGGK